jgi:response regulator RpfG family c-di-GMP phosphodiesterase
MDAHTILLVDDEPELLEICRETLEDAGHRVHTAGDGLQALDVLAAQRVDLVLSDIVMPRMNGMSLLREINARELDADVVFLTGYGTVENSVECLQLGAADYLLKPFDIRELVAKVNKVLHERRIRVEQQRIDGLLRMLHMSSALGGRQDLKSVLGKFLTQLQDAFQPDSLALFLARDNGALKPAALRGPLFAGGNGAARWLERMAAVLLEKGRPRLLDPLDLKERGKLRTNLPPELLEVSCLLAPLGHGLGRAGVVVLALGNGARRYAVRDLQLLTVFASHAAAILENVRANRKLQDLNMEVVTSLVRTVEAKDFYTRGHSERVGRYAVRLGRALGLAESELKLLRVAGLLHDIGKIGIPDSILNKDSRLTPEEFEVMKSHPVEGREILSRVRSLRGVLPVVFHHHEWMDGSGYPDGLAGDSIPFLSRVLSVADGYEALTSDRSYHAARAHAEAEAIITRGAGTQWDPRVVDAWFRCLRDTGPARA